VNEGSQSSSSGRQFPGKCEALSSNPKLSKKKKGQMKVQGVLALVIGLLPCKVKKLKE
jgi:hypothetical protein